MKIKLKNYVPLKNYKIKNLNYKVKTTDELIGKKGITMQKKKKFNTVRSNNEWVIKPHIKWFTHIKYSTNKIFENGEFNKKNYFKLGLKKIYKPNFISLSNNNNTKIKSILNKPLIPDNLWFKKDIKVIGYKIVHSNFKTKIIDESSKIPVKKIINHHKLNNRLKKLFENNYKIEHLKFIKEKILEGDTKLINSILKLTDENILKSKDNLEKYFYEKKEVKNLETWVESRKKIYNF